MTAGLKTFAKVRALHDSPHHADENEAVYPALERLLEKLGEPRPHGRVPLGLVQLRQADEENRMSPATAAGLSDRLCSAKDIAAAVKAATPNSGKRGHVLKKAICVGG